VNSLYLLIPISLLFLGVAVVVFFWAVNSGQYDDIDREAEQILFDENLESEMSITDSKAEHQSD
jgi:cbb3-type cytochrome oxidase maturation protein